MNVIYYASRTLDDAQTRYDDNRERITSREFDIEIVDKKGTENSVADHLSRLRIEGDVPIDDSLPEEQLMAAKIVDRGYLTKCRLEEA
ncbi:unnamed protein product [Microthlaspi erraticum]|uniref:Reverse transcriptase RNase H-like domain-containing protein n=1 Tax=Microthlaspi erraticum TaxID=1685480 RepID=A0A6D2LEQ6_9BRAS|nr:unnamed protein product [Microthlaspi erraticum]